MSTKSPVSPQTLPVTTRHDVYDGIDLETRLRTAVKGQVAFITGASGGIGSETALAFAKAGAEGVFLVDRASSPLEALKKRFDEQYPKCRAETAVADVSRAGEVKAAVERCVKTLGRIDVCIVNAGVMTETAKIGDMPPEEWWRQMSVNVGGMYSTAHFALPHLVKTRGRLLLLSSLGGQKIPIGGSAYYGGKHWVNRFAEFAHLEYIDQGVKTFALHPGAIRTELGMASKALREILTDSPRLSASTMVRLASGSEDWLSGRYVSSNWDLDEVAELRGAIEADEDALRNRLALPKL